MIDIRPLIFLAALPAIPLLAWGIRRIRFSSVDYSKILGAVLLAYIILFWFFLYGPFIGMVRYKTHPMTWSAGEPSKQYSDESHVILTFTDYPSYFVGFYSSEMADYLQKNGENTIEVVFRITSDYGKMRGYDVVKVGDLVLYKDVRHPLAAEVGDIILKRQPAWGYGGGRGEVMPSPWGE